MRRGALGRLIAGGAAGNERLTALTGVVLIAMCAALGVTILRIGQLLDPHMFIGMLLIGPVALKMASTGYRFVRYYAHDPAYRAKGPPPIELRMLAPLVVASTAVVFATGVALLLVGPRSRGALVPLHKISFIVWIAVTAAHVIAHLPALVTALAGEHRAVGARESAPSWDDHGSGRGARALALAGAITLGLVLALLAQSQFGLWAHFHHHHG